MSVPGKLSIPLSAIHARETPANKHANSLSAAKDAVGDKVDQKGHDGKADVHKEAAKH